MTLFGHLLYGQYASFDLFSDEALKARWPDAATAGVNFDGETVVVSDLGGIVHLGHLALRENYQAR